MKVKLLFTILIGFCFSIYEQALTGELNKQNYFGHYPGSVSVSGENAIVGAYNEDNSGAVYFYSRTDSGDWILNNRFFPNENVGDYFGYTVSIDGKYAVVGSYVADYQGANSGLAFVYHQLNNGTWVFLQKIIGDDIVAHDYFGVSVSIHEDFIAVGAHTHYNYGMVYLFKLQSAYNNFTQFSKITPQPSEAINQKFGRSVSIWKNQVLVQSELNKHIFFFEFDMINGNFTQQAKFNGGNYQGMYSFYPTSIANGYGIVGAPQESTNGGNAGGVHVFKKNSVTKEWNYHSIIYPDDAIGGDWFGWDVNLHYHVGQNKLYALVSSIVDDVSFNNQIYYNSGTSYLFVLDEETDTWKQILHITPQSPLQNLRFSTSVALSANYAIFGTSLNNQGRNSSAFVETVCLDLLELCENGGSPNKFCSACESCTRLTCEGGRIPNQYCTSCECPESTTLIGGYCQGTDFIVISIVSIGIMSFVILVLVVCAIIAIPIIFLLFCKQLKYSKIKNLDIIVAEQRLEEKERKNQLGTDSTSTARISVDESRFEVKFSEIKVHSKIGEGGSNSQVYLADYHGTKVAFKCFDTQNVFDSENYYKEFETEVSILAGVKFPFILNFLGASLEPSRIGILMEYCPNGDVEQFLTKKENINYDLDKKFKFIEEICMSMEYLHSKKIMHRDLKCKNVLITESLETRLMDFGLSRITNGDSEKTMTRQVGTSQYMAPEVAKGGKYSFEADVFSAAILVWEVVTQRFNPYGPQVSMLGIENKVATDPNFRPSLRSMIFTNNKWLLNLLNTCWSADPHDRISFEEMVKIIVNGRKKLEAKGNRQSVRIPRSKLKAQLKKEKQETPKRKPQQKNVKRIANSIKKRPNSAKISRSKPMVPPSLNKRLSKRPPPPSKPTKKRLSSPGKRMSKFKQSPNFSSSLKRLSKKPPPLPGSRF